MTGFVQLASTDVLGVALRFSSGIELGALRNVSMVFAQALSPSSPLWDALLRGSTAWLVAYPAPSMLKAIRLGLAADRCTMRLDWDRRCPSAHDGEEDRALRHRLVVTGARHSGVTSLVKMISRGPGAELGQHSSQDMRVYSVRVVLGDSDLMVSVVDKRSTAISTPLSSSLYAGHCACIFVFDAARIDESLEDVEGCIRDLWQTVGPDKFLLMPKLLICHKSDLLPDEPSAQPLSDAPTNARCLPRQCLDLLQKYDMDLVFTARGDQESADLAFALAADSWPHGEPSKVGRGLPTGRSLRNTKTRLRPTGTVVHPFPVVNTRPPIGNLFAELQARVPMTD